VSNRLANMVSSRFSGISGKYFDHNPVEFAVFQISKYPFNCCFSRHLPGKVTNIKIMPILVDCQMFFTGDSAHKCWTRIVIRQSQWRQTVCLRQLTGNLQICSRFPQFPGEKTPV